MTNDKKKSKRAAGRSQKTHAAKYFAKIAALNELIEKGGAQAKDAATAKVSLANQFEWKSRSIYETKKSKHKKDDALDSRARLPGSYESGKRR